MAIITSGKSVKKGFTIQDKIDYKGLKKAIKSATKYALNKAALQQLDWAVNGSPSVPETPPIFTGVLKASASAFVGKELVAVSNHVPMDGKATPSKTYTAGKDNVISLGFNTVYALQMHEDKLNPGKISRQAGNSNPGNQWALKHLKGDAKDLTAVIAKFMEKKL